MNLLIKTPEEDRFSNQKSEEKQEVTAIWKAAEWGKKLSEESALTQVRKLTRSTSVQQSPSLRWLSLEEKLGRETLTG